MNLFFEGVQGNDILWATAASHLNSFQKGSNQFSDLYGNYWTADNPNPNAKYPIVAANSEVSNSDRFVEDGSYLRLKSVRLAYDLPFRKLGFDKFDRAQIYVSGTNLFTITNYPGIDPDVNTAGTDSQDITRRLTTGVDESAYPLSKLYSVGLILGF